jgi:hypothetical protein
LGVSQYESIHPKLESQPNPNGNPESQQALERGWLSSITLQPLFADQFYRFSSNLPIKAKPILI